MAATTIQNDNRAADDSNRAAQSMQRFLQWLEDNGALLHGIGVRTEGDRRIAYATRPMRAGELVLFLPRRLLITSELAAASPIGTWFGERKLELTKNAFLAIFLLWTAHKGGFFAPYVDILPRDVSAMPVHFSEADLAWLEGTSALRDIRAEIERISAEYRELARHFPPDFSFSSEEYAWAASMVRSRAFVVSAGGKPDMAMVPLADMMDHAPRHNVSWSGQSRLGFICTAAADAIAGGIDLTDNYGPSKGNGKLFSMYGFTLEDNDDIELFFPASDCKPDSPETEECAQAFNPAARYGHPRTRAMFAHLRRLHGAPAACADAPVSRENERDVLETLHLVCCARLNGLRTGPAMHEARPARLRDALRVRDGELRVLHYLRALAESGIDMLDGAPADEEFEDYAEALAPLLEETATASGSSTCAAPCESRSDFRCAPALSG